MFVESAGLYDEIYTRMKDYKDEAEKVAGWMLRSNPQASSVLSVACGTGEHDRYLKERFEVDGIDLNGAFIEIARGKNPRGRYLVADMVSFELGKKYDAIICLFSSIGYVRTIENLEKTLQSFARHLNSGGVVIVEPWLVPENWNSNPAGVKMRVIDEPELKVIRMSEQGTQGRLSTLRFHYLVGRDNNVVYFSEDHALGLFTIEEQKAAFARAGLKVEHDPTGIFGRGLYVATLA